MDKVISGYRTVTGKSQIMPKWAMGFWLSRERYKTQEELLTALNEYRRRQVPLDVIVQDWSYWPVDAWGSHEFDKERFPDPKGMIREIHDKDARIMISVWPKFYYTTEHYKELTRWVPCISRRLRIVSATGFIRVISVLSMMRTTRKPCFSGNR